MGPAAPALQGRSRPAQAEACRHFLDEAHARIARAHEAGAPGEVTARAYAQAADEVVAPLFAAALAAHPKLEVALVAVGGYGRAELCPYSDLDLWFLVRDAGEPATAALAEAVLYPLWDVKLEVGHAVRTIDEALALAGRDLTAGTALLDARFVAGSRPLYDAFETAVSRFFQRDPSDFVRQLAEEKEARHARFGDTVYLLEPNVKNGQGGYRDLLVGLWAAKARFRIGDFSDLLHIGQASARQIETLTQARRFLLEIRIAAHLHAGRRADRLTFETQEAIAPRMVSRLAPLPALPLPLADPALAEVRPAVAQAVESLMQRYFLHAKGVKRETERLLNRCVAAPSRRPTVRKLDASFALFNGKLSTHDPEIFRSTPSEMVRLFTTALDRGLEIYSHTLDLVGETVGQLLESDPGALMNDARAAAELARLLLDDRDARTPSLLERAHDLGLLSAILPEFAPCTGRVQHDLYHVFTVDQHQLYALGQLKAIARGERAAELPAATQAMREVKMRSALYLGTLLHDVGKPLGKAHSEKGARLAVAIARRLGLGPAEVARTEFLVRHHLLFSHLSQRRDLSDVAMIGNLAAELGDAETLRQLYLLTVADMSMVAPGNLTAWKEQLLTELLVRTLAYFRHGPDLAGSDREGVAERRRKVAELVAARAGGADERFDQWFAALPDRYLVVTRPSEIVRHFELSRRRSSKVMLEVRQRPRRGLTQVTVCADDAPGLLAKIAGAFLASRIDVLAAEVYSLAVAPGTTEALDVFTVRDRYGRAIADSARWQRVEDDLRQLLEGQSSVEELIEARRERSSLPKRVVPAVRTEIEVDNDVSADFSVIDVYTQDRRGVLYTITRTLADLRLDIQLSKVATEASRVADIFYVREAGGEKLGPPRVDEVKLALAEALGALQAGS